MSEPFSITFTAQPEHIDVMGHVNNAVWVQWMEAVATAHWETVAPPEHLAAYAWLVTRHEIDYRGNIRAGETTRAVTTIPEGPRGARFDRHVEFFDAAGRSLVRAKSTWAMIDRQTGRLLRVTPEIAAPFLQ